MARNWVWIGKYVFVIVVALILGAALGNLGLFKGATLGTHRLTAAALVQFIAYGGALALLWLLGLRLSRQLRAGGGSSANLATMTLALMTLIVVSSAYAVLMQFIRPFLSRELQPFIVWAFILGTIAAAVWLVWAIFMDSEALIEAIGKAASRNKNSS